MRMRWYLKIYSITGYNMQYHNQVNHSFKDKHLEIGQLFSMQNALNIILGFIISNWHEYPSFPIIQCFPQLVIMSTLLLFKLLFDFYGQDHSLFYYDSSKDLHNDMNPSQPMSSKYLLNRCFRYVFGFQMPPEKLFLAYFLGRGSKYLLRVGVWKPRDI